MNIFDHFKRDKSLINLPSKRNHVQEIFFALDFDLTGAFIEVVNDKIKQVEFDSGSYDGVIRNLTKNIQLIQERNSFTIDWQNPEQHVYLHEHPYLISLLIESGKFISIKGEKISVIPNHATACLELNKKDNEEFSAMVTISDSEKSYKKFRFVAENYAYLSGESALVEVKPIGSYFNELMSFNVEGMAAKDLPKYLSLFYSFFENIRLKYENYQVVKKTEPLKARPAMIFEKVDQDSNLYMRISQIMPHADIDFLDDYDLLCFVMINELEESINIHPVEQILIETALVKIENSLRPYLPKGKKKTKQVFLEKIPCSLFLKK